ncbi:butyrate kinase [Deinococcus aquaedulcis]|uniref:butyrate kinase n=1 Tax=Deinococcus aquaedulcis TaxID=2840455 RepID=UPI001C83175F|nr:butyrate kinase [Deinococcus aquaedulcis]
MIAHVINPGSSGVKLACAVLEPSANPALPGQLRLQLTRAEVPLDAPPSPAGVPALAQAILALTADWPAPDAVVGRGGFIGRVPTGTYRVTEELAAYALQGEAGQDPPNLGGPLALAVARVRGVPAFIVDPQSADELLPEARLTGLRGVTRRGEFHALNARAVARRAAHEVGKRFHEARVVVAHLGATTSVTAFDQGRAVDTTGAGADGGPLGAMQSGPVPARALLRLAADLGERTLPHLASEGGFLALTGSANLRDLEARAPSDPEVQAVMGAFVHQVAKAIGEQTGALSARPDAIVLTGGIARWDELVDRIERRVAWMAPVFIMPGEVELEALAEGAGRVLLGLEAAREWTPPGVVRGPA